MKKSTVKKPVNKKAVKKVIKGLKEASRMTENILSGIDIPVEIKVCAAATAPTVDKLLAAVPEGWDVILRNDPEKSWFAHVFTKEQHSKTAPVERVSFSFYGNTPVAALSRAVDMAVAFQGARDAEAKDNRKPMAMLCISEDLLPIVQKAIDEAVK